ncbi:zinc finger CCCH domain-containing protein 20-like [Tasmannia lanceolata]|uniref:zinc finger CCCH domain-containing protein 20-like n=1 Tax=Tasmannia lanceolata TaxID=3420 RepID=UPI004064C828
MMLGEGNQANPTVHVPPWNVFDESTAGMIFPMPVSGVCSDGGEYSPYWETLTALHRYLPSNEIDDPDSDGSGRESDIPVDAFSCDEFRMYEFKVRRCARGRSHDWTECPFAHPGEKARRRDPRRFHYSGTACPDFRKGNCKRGDTCEFAHGVFECWLHPARYRTQPCKDGTNCRRRVCFFAHTPEQLRILPQQSPNPSPRTGSDSYDGSPLRQAIEAAYFSKASSVINSPTSTLISPPLSPPSESPPLSPNLRRVAGSNSVNEVLLSLRQLQLCKAKSAPAAWGVQLGGFGSPRGGFPASFPATPTTPPASMGFMEGWERGCVEEEPMERVESGRDLRAKIFEKLSKENSVENAAPDVGWVSELVK